MARGREITLQDLQAYADSLDGLSANTRKRAINSVKSLFTFGHKLGYLPFNVAAALKAPKVKNTLAERMLSESEVLTMIALTKKERDKLLLRLLYASAGRVSEVCGLKARDTATRETLARLATISAVARPPSIVTVLATCSPQDS